MKKIACIRFGGLASGGSEKVLQNIAVILAQNNYHVDYYYCDSAPYIGGDWRHPETDPLRIKYVESYGVNPIKFNVGFKNVTIPTHDWVDTNFWEVFDETKYDAIQTARYGHPEYPFTLIHNTPIIDGIHGNLSEDKDNIVKSILLSKWHLEQWANPNEPWDQPRIPKKGDVNKAIIIPTIVQVPEKVTSNFREKLGIPKEDFVYGLHQRNDENLFSPISLSAYSKISNKNNHFIILGGTNRHRQQAQQLNLNNMHFIDFSADTNIIHNFLESIDVFAHSRMDGEVCSGCIIEAMYHGKPVISYPGTVSNGHVEQIDDCGYMANSVEDYADKMFEIENNKDIYLDMSKKTYQKYNDKYSYDSIKNKILNLYNEILS